jgi:hypothetical protein
MDNAEIINFIRPNSQFVISNDDLATLVFHDDTIMPTSAEIAAGKKALEKKILDETNQKAGEKAALLAKLGITDDEAKLLLS